jgi:hypothetical protein
MARCPKRGARSLRPAELRSGARGARRLTLTHPPRMMSDVGSTMRGGLCRLARVRPGRRRRRPGLGCADDDTRARLGGIPAQSIRPAVRKTIRRRRRIGLEAPNCNQTGAARCLGGNTQSHKPLTLEETQHDPSSPPRRSAATRRRTLPQRFSLGGPWRRRSCRDERLWHRGDRHRGAALQGSFPGHQRPLLRHLPCTEDSFTLTPDHVARLLETNPNDPGSGTDPKVRRLIASRVLRNQTGQDGVSSGLRNRSVLET